MTRREILKITPFALFISGCREGEKFRLPTIVTGKVTYEDGRPVEGAKLKFSGYKRRSLMNLSVVFKQHVYSDISGNYQISNVVTKECDFIEIFMEEGSLEEPLATYGYNIYRYIDGIYSQNPKYIIPYSSYGKSFIVNYQLRKI